MNACSGSDLAQPSLAVRRLRSRYCCFGATTSRGRSMNDLCDRLLGLLRLAAKAALHLEVGRPDCPVTALRQFWSGVRLARRKNWLRRQKRFFERRGSLDQRAVAPPPNKRSSSVNEISQVQEISANGGRGGRSHWIRSTAASKAGSMVAAPTAHRTWRMDLRIASTRAWLAFSIKCQRLATW